MKRTNKRDMDATFPEAYKRVNDAKALIACAVDYIEQARSRIANVCGAADLYSSLGRTEQSLHKLRERAKGCAQRHYLALDEMAVALRKEPA